MRRFLLLDRWKAWWKDHWLASSVVSFLMLALITVTILGYRLRWAWTGLTDVKDPPEARTAWAWMSLLIVPVVLGAGAYLFKRAERRSDHGIAAERNQEEIPRTYLDRMSELLTRENLRDKYLGTESKHIARARTLTALRNLDSSRRSTIIRFLSDSSLTDGKILNLSGASLDHTDLGDAILREADLRGANLRGADLGLVNLGGADLRRADLSGANLIRANLSQANLSQATLIGADLSVANLSVANLSDADLSRADLRGLT